MGVDALRRMLPIGKRKRGIGSGVGASGEDGDRGGGVGKMGMERIQELSFLFPILGLIRRT